MVAVLPYVFVLAVSIALSMPLDSPSHFALPAAVSLGVYLGGMWIDEYTGKRISRTLYYLLVLLLFAFLGFILGYYAFFTTFVLFGAKFPSVSYVYTVLMHTPYWVVFPSIVAGWLGRADFRRLFDWD